MKTLRLCLFAVTLALLSACGESITQPEAQADGARGKPSAGPQMSGGWMGSGG